MPNVLSFKTGKTKKVKNLGWLLKKVYSGAVIKKIKCSYISTPGGVLLVEFEDCIFECHFASTVVMFHFLGRPSFYGLEVDWFGKTFTISKEWRHLR